MRLNLVSSIITLSTEGSRKVRLREFNACGREFPCSLLKSGPPLQYFALGHFSVCRIGKDLVLVQVSKLAIVEIDLLMQ